MNQSVMKSALIVCLLGLTLSAGCANQNEVKSLDIRLNEMETRNAEAQREKEALISELESRKQEERALRNQSAGLRAKVVALNEEIRALNGRVEELEHFFNRQKQTGADEIKADAKRIDRLAESAKTNDGRILRIEQYLNLEPRVPEAPAEKSDEKTVAKAVPAGQTPDELSEDEIYRTAKQAFDQGDPDSARKKFKELIEKFPKSERADNAQFWIGEIYYREKWYEKAILEYQKVIENYPKGNKVPASLLKQGLAFLNLGDQNNSRLILEELIKKHPKSNEAKIAKDKVKRLK
jgi:tol-pal system protein YbgF